MTETKDYIWDYTNPYKYLEKTRRGLSSLPPLIISVAITGGMQGKEANPNLPESVEEQAEQTYDAYKAGATIVHIHARRKDNPTLTSSDPEDYKRVNAMVREKCPDMIINNTTGGGPGMTVEERLASVYANPEICSLDPHAFIIRLMMKSREPGKPDVPLDMCIGVTYADTERYAKEMKERGVKAELEIYAPGEFWLVDNLIRQGLVDPPYWVQFVMGFQTSVYPTPMNLLNLIQQLPPQSLFSCIGIGTAMVPMIAMGIITGGHIRVGMEDNIYIEAGKPASGNGELVEKAVRLAREMGRAIATPKEARQMLGISEKPSQY